MGEWSCFSVTRQLSYRLPSKLFSIALGLSLAVAAQSEPLPVFPDANLDVCFQEQVVVNSWISTEDVESLNCPRSQIKSLDGLELLTSLTEINLSNNQIVDIAPLHSLTQLTSLDLSDNQLMDFFLPPSVSLTALNISGNPLQYIDLPSLLNARGLTELDLSYVDGVTVLDINQIISNNPGITKLGVAGLPLLNLQDLALSILSNLQWLDVSDTGLQDLYMLQQHTNLQVFYAANNKIEFIHELNSLPQLKELDLSGNRIFDVAPLQVMNQLTVLNLSDNTVININMLLSVLSQNMQLIELGLGGMQISDLNILPIFVPESKVQVLDLSNNSLSDIENLRGLSQLIELNLSGNDLDMIYPVDSLMQLEILNLSDNRIFDILPVGTLIQLKDLDLSNNQIVDVAPLHNLTQLTSLNLSGNSGIDYNNLLPTFHNNQNLVSLGLADIAIGDQPLDFSALQLQTLNLRNAGLVYMPPLTDSIKALDLSDNQLMDFFLPPSVSLTALDISGNPLQHIDLPSLLNARGLTELGLSYIDGVTVQDINQIISNNSGITKLGVAGLPLFDLQDLALSTLINLQWLDVSDTGLQDLYMLQHHINLQAFYAANNKIEFIHELNSLPQLKELDLSGNRIFDVAPLAAMNQLAVLNLSDNAGININILLPLLSQNMNLIELGLGGMQISDLNLLPIFVPESKLQVLDLSNNSLSDIENLRGLKKLIELDLSSNELQQIYSLEDLFNLEVLNLSDNRILYLKPLSALQKLKDLDLSDNELVFLHFLHSLTQLTSLNLSGNTDVDYIHFPPIAHNNLGLLNLGLADIAIGDRLLDFTALQLQALNLRNTGLLDMPQLTDSIKKLDLSDNQLMEFLLPPSVSLTALNISGNPLQHIDLPSLLNARGLTELDLSYVDGVTVGDINQIISNNPGITKLGVAALPLFDLQDLALSSLSNLQWLDVSDTGLQDLYMLQHHINLQAFYAANNKIEFIHELNSLPQLKELDLSGNRIFDVAPLAAMNQLTVLNLSGNAGIDINMLLPVLSQNMNLIELGLGGMQISDLSILPFFVSESKLQVLDLSNNNLLDIEAIRSLSRLVELNLSGNDLDAIDSLIELKFSANDPSVIISVEGPIYLKVLNLSDNRIFDVTPIASFPSVTVLNLSNNRIGLVNALYNSTQLNSLDISGNSSIDYNELQPIFNNNPNIISLGLAGIAIGDQPLDFSALQLQALNLRNTGLVYMPPLTDSIKALDLSDNQLMDFFLPPSVSLTALNISGNPLQHIDLPSLLNARGLTELDLSYVDGVTVAEINQIISNNPGITKLGVAGLPLINLQDLALSVLTNLQWLDVSDTGLQDLYMLQDHINLEAFYAANNNIEFIHELNSLPQLQELDLSGNRILDVAPLQSMNQLGVLNLSGNTFININMLLPVLSNNLNLVELGLGGMQISDLHLLPIFVPESKLKVLDLSNNSLFDVGMLGGLPQLVELNLSGNDLDMIYPVDSLVQLQILNLSDNRIFDILPVGTLMQLKELDLSNNQIVDIAPLHNLTQLTSLNLSGNSGINYNSLLPVFHNNQNLVSLSLADIAIGDQPLDVSALQLQTLNLSNTGLVYMPPLTDFIKELDLSDNQLMDFILPPSVSLTALDISGNPLQHIDLPSLLNARGLTELDLSYVDGVTVAEINQIISNNPGITKLRVAGLPLINLQDLALSVLTNLQWLDVSDTGLNSLVGIHELHNLKALYAAHNSVNNIGEVAGLWKLVELDLSSNHIDSVLQLSVLTRLSKLNLSNNPLINTSGIEMLSSLYSLQVLGNDHLSCLELDALITLPNLTEYIRPEQCGVVFGAYKSIGDFNADGNSDILWHHATQGYTSVWQMTGSIRESKTSVGRLADTNWYIAAKGDFDGDGDADLLWRHKLRGYSSMWLMDGEQLLSKTSVGTLSDLDWRLVSAADFDGDGKDDLLWHHQSRGYISLWTMDGNQRLGKFTLGTLSDTAWQVAGVADFNGDNKADILWHHEAMGYTSLWQMDGGVRTEKINVGRLSDTGWKVAATADFDADGNADILWHHESRGWTSLWTMDGGSRLAKTSLGTLSDIAWTVANSGDYNGDANADLVWHHSGTGDTAMWLLNSAVIEGKTWIGRLGDTDWKIQ